ncbi:MAG: alpha/beta fold hydrolase [Deltaproteobacteria bacterium]|nr:alpha/beta fold hydrolase [Deltaproteobacteria bacterium]MBW2395329.1 alpha/beta fold hydrolase [Deltaproteobacteria bacterium]
MQTTLVDGVEIAHEEAAPANGEGSGTPLVLMHGYTGFWKDFEGQISALAGRHRVLVPDLPGHGESGRLPAGQYRLDRMAELMAEWLVAVDAAPCHLLGHSMGGMIVLRMALEHPGRIASLVLMDTSAARLGFIQTELIDTAARVAREAGMAALASILRARAKDDPERSQPDRRVEEEWGGERFWHWRGARMEAMDPEAYAAFGHAMADAPSLEERLAEIACPTLVMVGAEDEPFLAPSEVLASEIPGALLATLPSAAHQPQNESPVAWLEALELHLERTPS